MDNFDELLLLLKSLLGVDAINTARDQALTAYLNGAIEACEKYLDNIINRREVSETWLRVASPIILRYVNASDLTAVTLDGADVLADWKLIAQDAFSELHRVDGLAYCASNEELKATYTAGYQTCPYDLMLAIAYAAAAIEGQQAGAMAAPGAVVKKENITGIGSLEFDTSATVGGSSFVGILPPQTTQVLDLYRRVRV